MKRLVLLLMALKGISFDTALDLVIDARIQVIDGADPEVILQHKFNVDSSYIDALVS